MNDQNIGSLMVSLGADPSNLRKGLAEGEAAIYRFAGILKGTNPMIAGTAITIAGVSLAFKGLSSYMDSAEGSLSNFGVSMRTFEYTARSLINLEFWKLGKDTANEGLQGFVKNIGNLFDYAGDKIIKFIGAAKLVEKFKEDKALNAIWTLGGILDFGGDQIEKDEGKMKKFGADIIAIQDKLYNSELKNIIPISEAKGEAQKLSMIWRDHLQKVDVASKAYAEWKIKIKNVLDLQIEDQKINLELANKIAASENAGKEEKIAAKNEQAKLNDLTRQYNAELTQSYRTSTWIRGNFIEIHKHAVAALKALNEGRPPNLPVSSAAGIQTNMGIGKPSFFLGRSEVDSDTVWAKNLYNDIQYWMDKAEASADKSLFHISKYLKDFGEQAKNTVSSGIANVFTSFGEMVGTAMSGIEDNMGTGLQKIGLILLDFLKQLSTLAISIGSILLLIPGGQLLGAELIAGGTAGMILASAGQGAINKKIQEHHTSVSIGVQGVIRGGDMHLMNNEFSTKKAMNF